LLWLSFSSSQCNWLHTNSYSETKRSFWIFFLQTQSLQHVASSSCWSQKMIWDVFVGVLRSMNNSKVLWLFLAFIEMQLFMDSLTLDMDHRMVFTHTSLGIKVIHFYLSSCSPISKVWLTGTHFLKHYIIDIFQRRGVWWKMLLG
jgi:hypothetical protein